MATASGRSSAAQHRKPIRSARRKYARRSLIPVPLASCSVLGHRSDPPPRRKEAGSSLLVLLAWAVAARRRRPTPQQAARDRRHACRRATPERTVRQEQARDVAVPEVDLGVAAIQFLLVPG